MLPKVKVVSDCVSPLVNKAEPCTNPGKYPASDEIGLISVVFLPSNLIFSSNTTLLTASFCAALKYGPTKNPSSSISSSDIEALKSSFISPNSSALLCLSANPCFATS